MQKRGKVGSKRTFVARCVDGGFGPEAASFTMGGKRSFAAVAKGV
jgi:hypothetical protein